VDDLGAPRQFVGDRARVAVRTDPVQRHGLPAHDHRIDHFDDLNSLGIQQPLEPLPGSRCRQADLGAESS
jgi:hypothetical protein